MRKVFAELKRRSKRGVTLVELIVALTLTMLFAVICIGLINPIERIYQRTEKTARAQLLADTIVDSIRKECDGIKNDDLGSVWIANGSFDADTASDQLLFDKDCGYKTASGTGSVLVIKKNNSYCEMIFADLPVTSQNRTDANDNELMGTNSGHAVDELFKGEAEEVARNTGRGVVHFGYYGAADNGNGIYPLRSYDYTNPVLASTYGDFYVKLSFSELVNRTENYDGEDHVFPSFVECEVKIYEGTYSASATDTNLVYKRKAAVSFSANGSRPGTSYADSSQNTIDKKNVKVTVIWDDNSNASGLRPDHVTIKLMDGDTELAERQISTVKDSYTFTFANVKKAGATVEQDPKAPEGYKMRDIRKTENGFVITNKSNSVKLIPGPDFNDVLKNKVKYVTSIRFGSEAALKQYIPDYENTTRYYKVSIDEKGTITDDYRLYYVSNGLNNNKAYVVSKDGNFLANEDCSMMFANCNYLEHVSDIGLLETSSTYTMEKMFYNCSKMKQFDVTGLIDESTGTAVSAESMFEGCTVAQEVCFNGCATGRISSMKRMFFNYSVSSAHEKEVVIDLSSFRFNSVTDMSEMFSNNKTTRTVIDEVIFPESHRDMPNLTTMANMFYKASGIKKISNFNDMTCNKLKSITCMFDYCSSITELDMHDFKMPNCELQTKYGLSNQNSAFKGCTKLETIILDGWDVRTASNMRDFFSNNNTLKTISLKDCNMPNIVTVEGMFISDKVLENVYMPGFVKDECRSIRSIFKECYKLKNIDISGWNTRNVDTMRDAFYMANKDCDTPLDVDLSGFSFLSATDFYRMFYQSGVHSVTFPESSPSNPIIIGQDHDDPEDARQENQASHNYFSYLFYECYKLTKVNNFNVSFKVCADASYIFNGCKLLGSESGNKVKYYIDVPAATTVTNMFNSCLSLEEIDITGSKFNKVSNFKNVFSNCPLLTKTTMVDVDLSNANKFDNIFQNSTAIETLTWNGIILGKAANLNFTNISSVKYFYLNDAELTGLTSIEKLFLNRTNLITVEFSRVTLPEGLDSAYQMFMGCKNLENITVDEFVSPRSLREMFRDCTKVTSFDLSSIDTAATENMYGMFQGCTGLDSVTFDGITADKLKTMDLMFSGCTNLKRVIFSTDENKTCGPSESASQIFSGCINIEEVDGFKAPADCTGMFQNCNQTKGIILANWDTTATANMSNMFYGCSNLETIDLSSLDTANVTNMSAMFQSCSNLCFNSSTWAKWNTSNVTNMSNMFFDCCYDAKKTNDPELLAKEFYINISNFSFASVTNMESMLSCGTKNDLKYDLLDYIVMPNDGSAPNADNIMYMFTRRSNTAQIYNLEHFIVTNKVKKARSMFSRLGVTELDIRGMDFSGTNNNDDGSSWIFDNCANLVTIYADPDKNYVPVRGSGMFSNSKKIVGGAGTTYNNSDGDNKKYAKIDGGPSNKGYFTDYHVKGA